MKKVYKSKVFAGLLITTTMLLAGCGSDSSDEVIVDNGGQDNSTNEPTKPDPNPNDNPQNNMIVFKDGLTIGEDIAVWGDYKQELFTQVRFNDNRAVLMLDDFSRGASYSSFGMKINTNPTDEDTSDEYALIEGATNAYTKLLKTLVLETYPGTKIEKLVYQRTRNAQSPVITTVLDIALPKNVNAVSADKLRDNLIYRLNNNTLPKNMPKGSGYSNSKLRLEISAWRDGNQVYAWSSVYPSNEAQSAQLKYGDISNATALTTANIKR